MAYIYAKRNDTGQTWNPLDPDNWYGGVVPGPGDVARMWYYTRTEFAPINGNLAQESTYNYFATAQYSNFSPSYNPRGKIYRQQFTKIRIGEDNFGISGSINNYFTSSYWSGEYIRGLHHRLNYDSPDKANQAASNRNSYYTYGNSGYNNTGAKFYQKGIYYTQNYNNTIGSWRAYNMTNENRWEYGYKDALGFYGGYSYGPALKNCFAYTFYSGIPSAGGTHGFTLSDGKGNTVTIQETDTEKYGSGNPAYAGNPSYPNNFGSSAVPFHMTKDQYLSRYAESEYHLYPIMERLGDLVTGSLLHVSNGGPFEIMSMPGSHCHIGTGYHYDDFSLNWRRYLTLYTVTSSINGFSYNVTSNMTRFESSVYYIRTAFNAFGDQRYFAQNYGDFAKTHYGPVMEGTSSMRYAPTSSINASGVTFHPNTDYNRQMAMYYSGSGEITTKLNPFHYSGFGPHTDGNVKFKFVNLRYNAGASPFLKYDETYSNWSSGSKTSLSFFSHPDNAATVNKLAGGISYTMQYVTPMTLQKWELTGSQHWNVGRIQMGMKTHFHVKDDAKITMHDQNTYGYPGIDFQYWNGTYCTLVVTDQAILENSSSRGTQQNDANNYGGINYYRSNATIIISGSANYSQSLAPSSSFIGDTSVQISKLSDHFGIGDYITLESTGSVEHKVDGGQMWEKALEFTGSSSGLGSSYHSGSVEEIRGRGVLGSDQYYKRSPNPQPGMPILADTMGEYSYLQTTHTIEDDEIVQIVTMSNDTATIIKMFGKQGEIQSDQGLYTRDQFASQFNENDAPDYYDGSKRVVLVDSNHRNFKKGELYVISGSAYKILHATTFLSQSHFYEFTSSNQPALEEVFDLEPAGFSGSSIFPHSANSYGTNSPTLYYGEAFKKERLLITGSYKGTNFYKDAYVSNNGYNSSRYGGSSGSRNGYRALQLDPTQTYSWRNVHPTIKYDYHGANWTTRYLSGYYQLKDTYNFTEGEITVSGSIRRDGNFDPTSSMAIGGNSAFSVAWNMIPQSGVNSDSPYVYSGQSANNKNGPFPYPYMHEVMLSYQSGPILQMYNYNIGNTLNLSDGTVVTGRTNSLHSGSFKVASYQGRNPDTPYRYLYSPPQKSIKSDPAYPHGLDLDALWASGSHAKNDASASLKPSSAHIKVVLRDGQGDAFLGMGSKELHYNRFADDNGRGRIAIGLWDYGSVTSINIKQRWQQLILDTQDSFNYRDKLQESGLLSNHYPNKDVKFIATEVADAKGFKNLLWDLEYTKGTSNIKPYMFSVCYTGTNAGNTQDKVDQSSTQRAAGHYPLLPRPTAGANQYFNKGQNNDNYYVIYDLRTPVTFDTIGMIFMQSNYGYQGVETHYNNMMNNVEFEVCNDVGVASPAWEPFRAKANDIRKNANGGDIRFYTHPSGSKTARFIKYHSRGGTSTANYRTFNFFGIYNFSGSCAESNTLDPSDVANGYAEQIGSGYSAGPIPAMCQIELTNTKNFSVGDMVVVWSKQMDHPANISPNYLSYVRRDARYITGYNDYSTPSNQIMGGEDGKIYTITKIQGNIVTFNKPITHQHIGKGTMIWKYNRGKVKLIGNRNLPFLIYSTTYLNDMKIKNATFINGYAYKSNNSYTTGGMPMILEDVGMYRWHEAYFPYFGNWNFLRNVIGTVPQGNINQNMQQPYKGADTINFNCFNIAQQSTYPLSVNFGHMGRRYIRNFCVDLSYYNYNGRVYFAGNAGFGYNGFRPPKVAFKNLYYVGSSAFNPAQLFSSYYNSNRGNNYFAEHIDIGNIYCSPWHVNSDFYNSESGNRFGGMKTLLDTFNKMKISRFHNFYFPSVTNLRVRHFTQYGYNTYTRTELRYFNSTGGLNDGTDQFLFVKGGGPSDRYGNRDHIIYKSNHQGAINIVPDINFKTNKEYSVFTYTNNGFNQDSNTNYWEMNPFFTSFKVTETCQVRIDLDFIYRLLSFSNKYGGTPANNNHNTMDYNIYGIQHPYIALRNEEEAEYVSVRYIDSINMETINSREVHTLTPGTYTFSLTIRNAFAAIIMHAMQLKTVKLRLVTPDTSKIKVLINNWNMLDAFNNDAKAVRNFDEQSNRDQMRGKLVKQASDLGGTTNYKFNKVKL